MKRVKCDSGIEGWQDKLQKVYVSLNEFRAFCEVYAIHKRLGYPSAKDAWNANPLIQGSTNPDDLRIVTDMPKLTYHRKPTQNEIKFGHGAIHYRDFDYNEYTKKDGEIKKRIKAQNDGLIYSR